MGKKYHQKKKRRLGKKLKADETPADLEFEVTPEDVEAAAERPEPFNEIRSEENVVALKPDAFAPFSFQKYEPTADDLKGYRPFPNADDENNYQLFIKECIETEGFDVVHFCNKAGLVASLNLNNSSKRNIVFMDCKSTIKAAIKRVNHELNSNFVLERIVKCNYMRGTTYFATIEVKDGDDGLTMEYQAEVQRDHFTGKTFVCKFRPRPVYPTSDA